MTKKTIAGSKFNLQHDLISDDAIFVIKKLQKNKFEAYLVGGGIRDLLLGKRPKDFDVVTNATPEEVNKIFRRNSVMIGRRFKIVHVVFNNINPEKMVNNRPIIEREIIEVSTFRSHNEHSKSLNEHGRIVSDNHYGNQNEDAKRRDFTINALYYDPTLDLITDYHNGLEDIENKRLRLIGDPITRFTEDPVRILRAVRLAVKLDLTIDKKTFASVEATKHLLLNEHKSRLYEEMLKILLSGSSAKCVAKLHELAIPKGVFPLFDKLFFKKAQDLFARQIIAKTDKRLEETPDVSTVFIVAGLFWPQINSSWIAYQKKGLSYKESLASAIAKNKDLAIAVGVPRNTYSSMSDVWLMQTEFEHITATKVANFTFRSRFRQALHLFNLRYENGEIANELHSWWNDYLEKPEAKRHEALANLPTKQKAE